MKGHILDLNLIRSVPYPGPVPAPDPGLQPGAPDDCFTDQRDHEFTYSLYPHPGDHIDGRVAQAGYELNMPLRSTPVDAHPGPGGRAKSYLQVDDDGVIVEAVKLAEDSTDIVVRLYECQHHGTRAILTASFDVRNAWEVNLMEEDAKPIPVADNAVELEFGPFEIKTLRLERVDSPRPQRARP